MYGIVFVIAVVGFNASGVGSDFFLSTAVSLAGEQASMRYCLYLGTDDGERLDCLNQILPEILSDVGPKSVMRTFDRYVGVAGEDSFCHNAGHVIGEQVYRSVKDVGASLASCTNSCHLGCHHGAVGAFLREGRLAQAHKLDVSTPPQTIFADRRLFFRRQLAPALQFFLQRALFFRGERLPALIALAQLLFFLRV